MLKLYLNRTDVAKVLFDNVVVPVMVDVAHKEPPKLDILEVHLHQLLHPLPDHGALLLLVSAVSQPNFNCFAVDFMVSQCYTAISELNQHV